jgi:hypothetical protein
MDGLNELNIRLCRSGTGKSLTLLKDRLNLNKEDKEKFEADLKKWLNDGIDEINKHSIYVHDHIR